MKSNPFLSIVIANYNYGNMLSTAIESIITQDCQDYELIIVDGGSKDNSVDVIKKYEKYISYWVSEPDRGQSHAFNEGFRRAQGEFITWLNADDILLPGTIAAVKQTLKKNPTADFATGNVLFFRDDTHEIINAPWGPHYLPTWLQGPGRICVVFGPTTFWRRKVYEKLGPIDESLHYTMDTDYWWRMTMAGHLQVRVNHYCWGFRMHPDSKTAEYDEHQKNEEYRLSVRKEHDYIRAKTGYRPLTFWKYIGYIFRILDGSHFKAIINRKKICGKNLKEYFKIDYNL